MEAPGRWRLRGDGGSGVMEAPGRWRLRGDGLLETTLFPA